MKKSEIKKLISSLVKNNTQVELLYQEHTNATPVSVIFKGEYSFDPQWNKYYELTVYKQDGTKIVVLHCDLHFSEETCEYRNAYTPKHKSWISTAKWGK